MSSETIYQAPRKYNVSKIRVHDYLYDSAYIVSGARDYARTAFRAAMASAQIIIQPVYKTMFSELRKFPRMHVVYHPNCRLPNHMDRSYGAYLTKLRESRGVPAPELGGKDRFKYTAMPKKLLAIKSATPDFHPPSPVRVSSEPSKPRSRGTQSVYRESSAQTVPWQPDAKVAATCESKPEVLYLDNLQWGPGCPYRTGDLPADFHTTEIINKLRHARTWTELVESGQLSRWMKTRDAVISDVETKDWIFREAEIDELQGIRLALLHKLQTQNRQSQANRTSRKLEKLWMFKKQEMERKVNHIRRTRDRELRKLIALRDSGGQAGKAQRMRAARGAGSVTLAAHDPTSDVHAPLARHGYQARRRHAEITYDPSLLVAEDHEEIAKPPEWLEQCGQDLKRSCSGHHLRRDPTQLCERETKWSEKFLENLHNDLKKARLGAASAAAGPLHVLKPRRLTSTLRPSTPEVEAVQDQDEAYHQSALMLQRVIRGRAVQNLMYEGRSRAAELTEELKSTHGLQPEDEARIHGEEITARQYEAARNHRDHKEHAITALVAELCGGAVSAALDFLEKELRRLKEERRQHAFILIALREKTMREAAEAGRRQKEEQRRREHDEMFKQIVGVTQETVDVYLRDIVQEGVQLAAQEDAVRGARAQADRIDLTLAENEAMSTAEQNELVSELVQRVLLPHAHRSAARLRVTAGQGAHTDAARRAVFALLDDAEIKEETCARCGVALDEQCRCRECPLSQTPLETSARDDPRWIHTRRRPAPEPRTLAERYPPEHEFRCLLNSLVDDAVTAARRLRCERDAVRRGCGRGVRELTEVTLDARDMIHAMIDRVVGASSPPLKVLDYHHFMLWMVGDALDRSEPFDTHPCPTELPSAARQRAQERAALEDPTCRCADAHVKSKVKFGLADMSPEARARLLPSELRELEQLRRCKCDGPHSPTDTDTDATLPETGAELTDSTDNESPDDEVADETDGGQQNEEH